MSPPDPDATTDTRITPVVSGDIDGFALCDAPGHLLRRAAQRASEIFTAHGADHDMTPRQFSLLVTIRSNPGLSQSELVARTGIDRSTMADMVARLESRDMIRRKRSRQDRRVNTLLIAPAGEEALASAIDGVAEAQQRIIEVVPLEEREAFLANLRRIATMQA